MMNKNSYKIILVGDLHSKNSNLEETKKLFEFIDVQAKSYGIKDIFLLGDLFDTHGIVHLPVTYCYYELFNKYSNLNFYCLVGNHDYVVHGSQSKHALVAFYNLPNVVVIDSVDDEPFTYQCEGIQFDCIPHTTDEYFYELCKKKKSDVLLCHHTFIGAQYENNFFAPNGIDLSQVLYSKIVSGHIHKQQSVGKVYYPGTPRWLKESDANEEKGIWLWDGLEQYQFIATDTVCQKIHNLYIDESTNLNIDINENHRYILNVKGDFNFVEKVSGQFKNLAEIRQVPVEHKKVLVKESEGILNSLQDFVKYKYKTIYGVDNEELWNVINSRLNI